MALVSGARSSLNPNAPLFIPASVRQVEDFSPEWWDLVTTASWFRDYWLTQHQGEDLFWEEENGFGGNNDIGMLPDNIDLDVDEDILNMEAQFEEFLHSSSEAEYGFKGTPGLMGNGFDKNVDALMRSLSMGKERGPKSPREVMMKHHWEKPAKHASPKQQGPRFIQQPR